MYQDQYQAENCYKNQELQGQWGKVQCSQQGWHQNRRNREMQQGWDQQRQNQAHSFNSRGNNPRTSDARNSRPPTSQQKWITSVNNSVSRPLSHESTNLGGFSRKRPLETKSTRGAQQKRKKGRMFAAERRAAKNAARKLQPGFTKAQLLEKLNSFVSVGNENLEDKTEAKSEKKLINNNKGLLMEQDAWGLQKMYGKGFKLLSKSGWKPGKTLGLQGQGIPTPLITITKSDKRGIAHGQEEKRSIAARPGQSKKKAAERRRMERRRMEKLHGLPRGALTQEMTAPGCGTAKTRAKKRAKWRKGVEKRLGLHPNALTRFGHTLVESAGHGMITNIELEFGIQPGRLVAEVLAYRKHIRDLRNNRSRGGTTNGRVPRFNYSNARCSNPINRGGYSNPGERGGHSSHNPRRENMNQSFRGGYSVPNTPVGYPNTYNHGGQPKSTMRDSYSDSRRSAYTRPNRKDSYSNGSANHSFSNHNLRNSYSNGAARGDNTNSSLRGDYSNCSSRGAYLISASNDNAYNTLSQNRSYSEYNNMPYFNKSYNKR